jgi:uncharacterized protein (TIGR00297 family)
MVSLTLSALLGHVCYRHGLLTSGGATAAFLMGSAIGILGSPQWLLLLVLFAILGFVATRIGFYEKQDLGVQEGQHGERGSKNIIGVALPPLIMAIMDFAWQGNDGIMAIAYVATIAVAAADTAASELGVRDPNVWLITTFKKVPPGTDGGVSVKGTIYSTLAAIVFSLIGFYVVLGTMDWRVLIPILCGIVGCFADSLIGATLETKGLVNKYVNNCTTGILGGLLAIPLCLLF